MKVTRSQVNRISQMHKLVVDIGEIGISEMLFIKDSFQEWNDKDFKTYTSCQEQIANGLLEVKKGIMALEQFLLDQMEKDGVIDDSIGEENASTTVN